LGSRLTAFCVNRTAAFLSNLRSTFTELSSLPIPTISAVSSLALGGGLELALCTHLRVFASTAQVGLPETRLGIIPGAGGTYRLPAVIGLGRARDLILTGRRVSAAEAYFLGIADRLVEVVEGTEEEGKEELMKRATEEVLKEAVRLAGEICEGAPVAIRSALQAVGYAREEVENKMYERVVGTSDRDEALVAFREKRRPVFTGR
jgi:methylglutaconyl-CoA hydratase